MSQIEKVNCSTPDFAKENVAKLLALFPECAGEQGEVDFDKLRQTLSSSVIEGNVERYEFTWPGKRAAKAAASAATTKALRPCAAESVGRDGTPGGFDSENLYIEGDNLEVLKLLQTSYANQVKMIYIDPPYNTGHDFVYRDRFSLTQKELESEAGVFDEDGNRFEVNDSFEARYHSNWCSMMYPRLKLARNLLRDDGVIFISIDDNEVTNMRKLCDEIFGECNFIGDFIWQSRLTGGHDSININCVHEFIVVYGKSETALLNKIASTTEYPLYDATTGKSFKWDSLWTVSHGYTPNCDYPIYVDKTTLGVYIDEKEGRTAIWPWMCHKDGEAVKGVARWFWSKETFLASHSELSAQVSKGQIKVYKKVFGGSGIPPLSVLDKDDVGGTSTGKDETSALLGRGVFDNPKNTKLIGFFLRLGTEKNSLIVDFFSGSATTAHATMQLNSTDGGNRKFIMVQFPELCDEDSEAAKAGYANICEIGKERIRRAGKKIAEELAAKNAEIVKKNEQGELSLENPDNPVNPVEKEIPDIGFRVLKLDTSSLRDTSATVSETNQEFTNFERIKSDRSPEDLLFQVLLETRISLSDPIETKVVSGNNVFFVSGNALVACLDPAAKMTTAFFIEIAKMKPGIAFFRDDAFADDSARTNLQQAFDQFSPTTSIKVI